MQLSIKDLVPEPASGNIQIKHAVLRRKSITSQKEKSPKFFAFFLINTYYFFEVKKRIKCF